MNTFGRTDRRGFLRGAGIGAAALAGAACAPAAAPAGETTQAGARAPWEDDWDKLVQAAKREGKLVVATFVGESYRKVYDEFEKAFPGITVDHSSYGSGSLFAPKVLQERDAGIYSWDVNHVAPSTSVSTLLKVWDPVRDYIFPRPDVVDDANWHGGFEWGFIGPERKFQYAFRWIKRYSFWVNTDLVKTDVKTVKDLLDPRWKGKIQLADPRTGDTFIPLTAVRLRLGDEVLKQLVIDQQPSFSRDYRQMVEQMVRGNFAISNGIRDAVLKEFLDQGLGKNLKQVAIDETVYVAIDHINVFKNAPHPNAAKLYTTWLLTKEGQMAWEKAESARNSRRKDVPPWDPNGSLKDGEEKVYKALDVELEEVDKTQQLLNALVR